MISNFISIMAQTPEVEPVGLFPFPLPIHLAFCIISLIFFVARFVSEKHIYQLILAVAIPLSLTIHVSEERLPFYALGIIEGILLLIAFIAYLFRKKKPEEEQESNS
ncbi:MAG TPA: hypothetical protein PLS20_08115 [Ruminococcus flavefaciens]|nr:hypothetical protein [Ruminococcus flavefaciens]